MLSRIFWILLAGAAFVGGIAVHERDLLFGWSDGPAAAQSSSRSFESRIDRAVDRSFDKMKVLGSNGKEIEAPSETKRELAGAVRRLVAAEAELALTRVRHESDSAVAEARNRRDAARSDVDRLKTEIEHRERLSDGGGDDAVRDHIRRKIRDDIHDSIRTAIRG